jgi:S-adenosylmethionine uptake transporter
VLVGASVFPLQDVVIKKLSGHYPVLEIVFLRGLVSMWALALLAWWERGPAGLWTRRPGLHAVRGLLGVVSFTGYYMAIAALPLADVVAVSFASPLFLTALSALALGEPVGARRWGAVLIGLAGVLVVLRPGTSVFEPAALLVVVSALFYAVSQTITRHLGSTDSAATIALTSTLFSLPVAAVGGLVGGRHDAGETLHPSLAFLLRGWVVPGPGELGLMALCGVLAGIGAYSLAQAYRAAPASTVAPFEYVMIIWAVLWGYVFWGDVPGGAIVVGVAMIVGAGLWVVHHQAGVERDRRRAHPAREKLGRGARPTKL